MSKDPLHAVTRSAYGYVYGNPLNVTDPMGLWSIGIPEWISPVGAALGINCFGPDCQSIAEQHPEASQGIADFSAGLLDGVTVGNAQGITRLVGANDSVNWDSGLVLAGYLAGTAILLPAAGSSQGVTIGSKSFAGSSDLSGSG